MKKVLLVGSGAREHAIAFALTKHGEVELYSCQGYSNYGITKCSKMVLETETDFQAIMDFAKKNNVEFAVVGPEAQLQDGIVDMLEENGIPCASPRKKAARIESDKMFMRNLLNKYSIEGNIKHVVTDNINEAIYFCKKNNWQVAVKPIGLTSGKGVKVWGEHLKNEEEVIAYITEVISTGMSGYSKVLLEELLVGQEFTIHYFCDGTKAIPTISIQDHKRAYNNDKGPNTGGMGAYSEVDKLPFITENDLIFVEQIGNQVINALKIEGSPFRGVLYGQYIKTEKGIKIIEFNSRFGDPEAMNTLMLLKSNFVDICIDMINGNLDKEKIEFNKKASLCVYIVPYGYGIESMENEQVFINYKNILRNNGIIFFGSCNFQKKEDDTIIVSTTRSRTLAICAMGNDLKESFSIVSKCLKHVSGKIHYRTDIGSDESINKKIKMIENFNK